MEANGDAEAGRRQRTFAALSNARGNFSMPMIDLDAARERAAALKERLAETSAKLAERSEKTAAAFQEKVSAASQRAAPTIDALKERALKERDALKERAASLPSSSRMMSMMSSNVNSEKLESKLGSLKAWGHSAVDRMAKMTAEQRGHAPSQSADNDGTAAGIYRHRRADVDSDEEEMEAKVPTADLLGGELLDGACASGSRHRSHVLGRLAWRLARWVECEQRAGRSDERLYRDAVLATHRRDAAADRPVRRLDGPRGSPQSHRRRGRYRRRELPPRCRRRRAPTDTREA